MRGEHTANGGMACALLGTCMCRLPVCRLLARQHVYWPHRSCTLARLRVVGLMHIPRVAACGDALPCRQELTMHAGNWQHPYRPAHYWCWYYPSACLSCHLAEKRFCDEVNYCLAEQKPLTAPQIYSCDTKYPAPCMLHWHARL